MILELKMRFSLISDGYVFIRRLINRLKMLLLMPAFERHGKHFLFDPDGFYSFRNIEVGDYVSLGRGPVLLASESKIRIGNKVMFGPGVTIIGGNHNASVVGKFMYDVHEKRPEDDQDVVIEEDVWVGTGAILLKGIRVGRGSIIAAGAVVNRDVPPYTICGGVPARVLSARFDIDTILEHEKLLYPPERRFSRDILAIHLEQSQWVQKK